MSESLIPVPEEWRSKAYMTAAQYEAAYGAALKDPDGFWRREAARLDWIRAATDALRLL